MTTALYAVGSQTPIVQTEEEARPGLEPIRPDSPAEATDAPDWNEVQTDDGPLGHGLFRRTEGAYTVDTKDYKPWWAALIKPLEDGISLVFNRQADMGTAASREVAGEQGHGTMQYAESIDPVIRPGAAFGNDYFATRPKPIQEGSGDAMQPIDNDSYMHAVAQSRGNKGEADARAALYGNFYRSV